MPGFACCASAGCARLMSTSAMHAEIAAWSNDKRFMLSPPFAVPASIPRIPRRARIWDRVPHVRQAGDVGERALEAQPKARVRHRAVAAQVPVPAVVLLVD